MLSLIKRHSVFDWDILAFFCMSNRVVHSILSLLRIMFISSCGSLRLCVSEAGKRK